MAPKKPSPCPTIRFTGATFASGAYRNERVMTVTTKKVREVEPRVGGFLPSGGRRIYPALTEYKAGKYNVCAESTPWTRKGTKPAYFFWSEQPCDVVRDADAGFQGYSAQKWVTLHALAKQAVADGCTPREAPSIERALETTGLVVRGGRGVKPDALEIAKRSLQRFSKSILGEPLAQQCNVDVSFCAFDKNTGGDCTCVDEEAEAPRNFRIRLQSHRAPFDVGHILAHELQHVAQMATGRLRHRSTDKVWEGTTYDWQTLKRIPHDLQPWEKEANATEARVIADLWEIVREFAAESEPAEAEQIERQSAALGRLHGYGDPR